MSSIPAASNPTIAPNIDHDHPPAARLGVYGLVGCACALFGLSLQQPWWFFRLYAPQYPRGLTLNISLRGLSGDVREIDMLNHYIGMAHLDEAAMIERQFAVYAVALLAVGLLALARFARPAWSWLLVAVGALFPLGFLADSVYWLHRFGHTLDARAPLRLPAFTPQLFGNGTIGQFMTFARPERGFWIVVVGVVLLGFASLLRARPARRRTLASARVTPPEIES